MYAEWTDAVYGVLCECDSGAKRGALIGIREYREGMRNRFKTSQKTADEILRGLARDFKVSLHMHDLPSQYGDDDGKIAAGLMKCGEDWCVGVAIRQD